MIHYYYYYYAAPADCTSTYLVSAFSIHASSYFPQTFRIIQTVKCVLNSQSEVDCDSNQSCFALIRPSRLAGRKKSKDLSFCLRTLHGYLIVAFSYSFYFTSPSVKSELSTVNQNFTCDSDKFCLVVILPARLTTGR